MPLAERIDECVTDARSLLCVGLDPAGVSSAAAAERFCIEILEATLAAAAAVKANLAFFEQFGSAGYAVLERLRGRIPANRLLILDGKRGDIANTAEAYARALFGVLGADAITVNPLLGGDAVAPFLAEPGHGVFLVARSSNPGAADLLDATLDGGAPLHRRIVELGRAWDPGGQVGFVVGATDPGMVAEVRAAAGDAPLLVPGVGAQGGALEEAVLAGADSRRRGLLISVSRGIAAAPEGPARAAADLRARIEAARSAVTLA